MAENDRLGELPAVADVFDDIMAAVRGEVKATVTTAEVRRRSTIPASKGEHRYSCGRCSPSAGG